MICRSFSSAPKNSIIDFFKKEKLYSHHLPGKKIEALNNWIVSGKQFPCTKDDEEIFSITKIARKSMPKWDSATNKMHPVINKAVLLKMSSSLTNVIEIGGGNSPYIPFFLSRRQKVTLIEPNLEAIQNLYRRIEEYQFDPSYLTVINEKVENYPFKEKNSLIIAKYTIPYWDPEQFLNTWQRIENSLEQGGIVTGNFFCHPKNSSFDELHLQAECLARFDLGTWLITQEIAKELFSNLETIHLETAYEHHLCADLNFIVQKKELY